MPELKAIRGMLPARSHPLARGLVGCWLLNERCGNKIFDLSGNGGHGTFSGGDYSWASGKFGNALYADEGQSEPIYLSSTYHPLDNAKEATFIIWMKPDTLEDGDGYIFNIPSASGIAFRLAVDYGGTDDWKVYASDGTESTGGDSGLIMEGYYGSWIQVALVFKANDSLRLFINGIEEQGGNFPYSASDVDYLEAANAAYEIADYSALGRPWCGTIDNMMLFARALSSTEITTLYREPFCMFGRRNRPNLMYAETGEDTLAGLVNAKSATSGTLSRTLNIIGSTSPTAGLSAVIKIIHTISGSTTGISNVTALLKSTRGISAVIGAVTSIGGSLSATGEISLCGAITANAAIEGTFASGDYAPWVGGLLETERNWIREALFNGMTTNAVKLGTTLSMGWFWVRVAGCSALYRGAVMKEMDFVNILTVAENEANEISPPGYNPHETDSTCFYVLRQFNKCGYQEHTLAAAAKISIDTNGDIASPQPNNIFSSITKQTDGNTIRLVWFYCQLEQKSGPIRFNIYYDNGTGQIDYQNPLATISYNGPRFYSYQIGSLQAGEYLFAIRAEDFSGTENNSLTQQGLSLKSTTPNAVNIVSAEGM